MATETVRVFLGNVPPGITESDLEKKVKKYAHVTSVELKQKDCGTFAFVDISDTKTNVERFFEKLSSKSWKGHQLRVQKAKESFLVRLAKERRENEILRNNCNSQKSLQNVAPKIERFNTINKSKKNIEDDDDLDSRENGGLPMFAGTRVSFGGVTKIKTSKSISISPSGLLNSKLEDERKNLQKFEMPHSVWEDSNEEYISAPKLSKKVSDTNVEEGGLPKFAGTRVCFGGITKKRPSKSISISPSGLLNSKLEEERKILQKFEMSHSVWKDSNEEYISTPKLSKKVIDTNVEDDNLKVGHNVHLSTTCATDTQKHSVNGNRCVESEMRRLKAIDERQKELVKRKETVKLALSSIDSRSNNKIVFGSSDDEVDLHENINISSCSNKSKKEEKLQLFNEDEVDDNVLNNESDNDFRIRNKFEGRKGQALLKLQVKYGNDKRFTLDERFIDSDDDTKSEREKMLHIGGGITRDIKCSDTIKEKPMLRYDPSKSKRVQFEVKNNIDMRINKKRKKDIEPNLPNAEDDSPEVSQNQKVIEDTLPVLSKERFYHVSDTLLESFKNKGQPFSLSEMFGEEVQEKKEETASFDATPIPIKPKRYMERIVDESSEEEQVPQGIDSFYAAKGDSSCNSGINQESLFFKEDDPRFLEGSLFFCKMNTQFIEEFSERRQQLRKIVKSKIQKKKRREPLWSTKLGRRNSKKSSA